MPCSGCLPLHGVNPNFKKSITGNLLYSANLASLQATNTTSLIFAFQAEMIVPIICVASQLAFLLLTVGFWCPKCHFNQQLILTV